MSEPVLSRFAVGRRVERYELAWRTAGTEPLSGLFAPAATYRMSPYEAPATGLSEIAALWEREREGPGEEFEMSYEVVAVEGDTAVVRVEVEYGPPNRDSYRDLWIVRFDADGLCREFEEWPFWPGQEIIAQGGQR